MPFTRDQLEFGQGSFIGVVSHNPEFFDLPIDEQARMIGWAVGCPVVNKLIAPPKDGGRGAEVMLRRYFEIGTVFGLIVHQAETANPLLHQQLIAPVKRAKGEPAGIHESESVPENYKEQIPPTETLVGYGLPRLLIRQFGSGLPETEAQPRFLWGLRILNNAVVAAETPEALLAVVAEGIAQQDVPPEEVLSTILSRGWYEEHNADSLLEQGKAALQAKADNLWQVYEGLTGEQKVQLKIK